MIILKILGIILAVILCILLFVLLCPVNIKLWTDENKKIKFAVKLLFININNQKENKPQEKETEGKTKENFFKAYFDKYGFTETVSKFFELAGDALKELSFILHRAKFKKVYLTIICGTDDASKTALSYGRICSAVYPATAYLYNNFKVSKDAFDINIGCNFDEEKFDYSFELEVSLLSFSAVISVLKLFRKYRKIMH